MLGGAGHAGISAMAPPRTTQERADRDRMTKLREKSKHLLCRRQVVGRTWHKEVRSRPNRDSLYLENAIKRANVVFPYFERTS